MKRTHTQRQSGGLLGMPAPFLAGLLDSLWDALIVRKQDDLSVVYASSAVEEKLGVSSGQVEGESNLWLDRVPPSDRPVARAAAEDERQGIAVQDATFRITSRDGELRWLNWQTRPMRISGDDYFVTAIRDVTDQHAEREALREQALRDPLTGLWNRRGLATLAEHEMRRTRRTGESISAILIDLDDFKTINERFGHDGGDRALRSVSRAIEDSVRPTDPVARIGGDEFLVLLPGAGGGTADRIAERIRRSIERAGPIPTSASLGVALLHDDPITVESAIRRTQSALMQSKRVGKNRVCRARSSLSRA